jgi:hypothetical protein
VSASEAANEPFAFQRVAFRRFEIQSSDVPDVDRNSSGNQDDTDDFIYDTGFTTRTSADRWPASPDKGSRLRFRVIWVSISALAIFLALTAIRVPVQGWLEGSSAVVSPKKSGTVLASAFPSANANDCVSKALSTLAATGDWNDSTNRFPAKWLAIDDVTLGGVEQILVEPYCGSSEHNRLVVILVKAQNQWKLKSAAPEGPHF